jgi:mono/diheme cytochrome c family protein
LAENAEAGRLNIFRREAKTSPAWVAEARANPAFDAGPAFAHGRHLAVTLCSECHGSNLKGQPGFTPDLLMAASYDAAGFSTFLRTGVAADGKEKGLMTEVARGRLVHLSDQEIADLYAYLRKRAEDAP